jgi:hypothetical protein
MQKARIAIVLAGFAVFCLVSYPQSLGDVARQQREKQAAKTSAPRKIVTDEDIPSHPAEAADSPAKDSNVKTGTDENPAGSPINSSTTQRR